MWHLAEDTISSADRDALASWLRSCDRLTQGEQVHAFEDAWARWLGIRHAIMVTSGSTANLALVLAVCRRVERPVPRVGVAATTWATNVTPSLMLGHDVVAFDVSSRTLGIAPDAAVSAMERGDLDILFVTHLLGFNAISAQLLDTAVRTGVVLLEDCCEAHGTRFQGRHVGTFGLGSTFSFYFGHHMSTVEGGMVCTDDDALADELRLIRGHGLARESSQFAQHSAAHPMLDPRFLFVEAGCNFRSTDINAFLGLRQLETLDERIAIRNRNLSRLLDGLPDNLWHDYETNGVSSFALPLVSLDAATAQRVRTVVDGLDIEARPIAAGNLLRQPFVKDYSIRADQAGTSMADHVHGCGLYVGNGHHVTVEMVDTLTERLRDAVRL